MEQDLQDDPVREEPEEEASEDEDFDPRKAGFKFRDISNFLSGRGVMVAREVDYLCRQFKDSPKATQNLADYFNTSVTGGNFMAPDLTTPRGMATLNVMQRPEFKEIRDHFLSINEAVKLSSQAMLGNKKLQDMESSLIYDPDKDVFKISPEVSQILVCDPEYMDPIISLKHLPTISETKLRDFERAAALEELRLSQVLTDDAEHDTGDYGREIEATAPAVNDLLQRAQPKPGLK